MSIAFTLGGKSEEESYEPMKPESRRVGLKIDCSLTPDLPLSDSF